MILNYHGDFRDSKIYHNVNYSQGPTTTNLKTNKEL